MAPAAFGVAAVVVGTARVAVAAAVAVGSAAPLRPVCTVVCGFVTAAVVPAGVAWVVPFASVAPAVVDVASDVVALSSASAADVADVDWSAAARAAAAMASGAVLEPLTAVVVVGVVVAVVGEGVLVSVTVTGSMTAIAVGTMPVVTPDDELAVEPSVAAVVVVVPPSDDDCVLDDEESSFEDADLLRECRGPSLPLA